VHDDQHREYRQIGVGKLCIDSNKLWLNGMGTKSIQIDSLSESSRESECTTTELVADD